MSHFTVARSRAALSKHVLFLLISCTRSSRVLYVLVVGCEAVLLVKIKSSQDLYSEMNKDHCKIFAVAPVGWCL